ncbi:ribulose-bisphosphate carboxylase-like protein; rubisco-like protein, partial [hydrothermal vent metagenome]
MEKRFGVSYRIFAASEDEAEGRASDIALEQTVEIPSDVVPAGYIGDVVVGDVASVIAESENSYVAKIKYSLDAVGDGFSQLLNVVFGNSSIKKGLKVIGLTPNKQLMELFGGANFGAAGLRTLVGRKQGGFVCPVIKPVGSTSEQLAEIAYMCARAGADIIKEDHGLANQP